MIVKNLPHDLSTAEEQNMPIIIRSYRAGQLSTRNKSIIHENMIDMVISGKKKVLNLGDVAELQDGDLILLSKGNNLISEILPESGPFSSIVIYFTNEKLSEFLIKYDRLARENAAHVAAEEKRSILVYHQDPFIRTYMASVQQMMDNNGLGTPEFKQLKLEELLLYLLHLDAAKFYSLLPAAATDEDMLVRRVAEHNIGNPVTAGELAFLCNMSGSTFRRKFVRIYGVSPVQWLVQQKLNRAADLLKNPAERPAQVFEKIGYENHSSFSQAFKKQFHLTPTEYQEKNMNLRKEV